MKELYVSDLKNHSEVTDFFMVKMVAIKLGSNKKQYLDITLGDKTGDVSSKKWDVSDAEVDGLLNIAEGNIVKVKAQVTEWQGLTQLRINRIRIATEQDEINLADFIKTAPEKSEDMYDFIYKIAEEMEDEDFSRLCIYLLDKNREKLMYYPAASKNHHAEYGGLLYHVKRMLMNGLRVCEVYPILDRDLVATGVIIHDIEKLTEIEANEQGISSGYSFEGNLLGHIVQGIKVIDRIGEEIKIPKEKALMLEHMILSHHYEPEFGSPKKPLFPEAEVLHYLDILDARMFDMEEALKDVKPGAFSERVWTLENRKIYQPEYRNRD